MIATKVAHLLQAGVLHAFQGLMLVFVQQLQLQGFDQDNVLPTALPDQFLGTVVSSSGCCNWLGAPLQAERAAGLPNVLLEYILVQCECWGDSARPLVQDCCHKQALDRFY